MSVTSIFPCLKGTLQTGHQNPLDMWAITAMAPLLCLEMSISAQYTNDKGEYNIGKPESRNNCKLGMVLHSLLFYLGDERPLKYIQKATVSSNVSSK